VHERGEEFGTLRTGVRVKESRGVRDYGQGICMREEFVTLAHLAHSHELLCSL